MIKYRIFILMFALLQGTVLFSLAEADSLSAGEKQRIEALIKYVAESKEVEFVRNGASYSAATATTFLRLKWRANESEIKTARDFIEKVATMSVTSGKPYLIRFRDGSEMKSKDFLLAELGKLEK